MPSAVRRATEDDLLAVQLICLLTANAGTSAQLLYDFGELPGLIWATPYLSLPYSWAFVAVDGREVVGYVVGTTDTRTFERQAASHWWPVVAANYPPGLAEKEADRKAMELLRAPRVAAEAAVGFSKAHLHINLLEEYQGRGIGRRLIGQAVRHLRGEGLEGVWVSVDPRNEDARGFYEHLGFRSLGGAEENLLGLRFEDFIEPKFHPVQ